MRREDACREESLERTERHCRGPKHTNCIACRHQHELLIPSSVYASILPINEGPHHRRLRTILTQHLQPSQQMPVRPQVESGMLESVQDACRMGVESYGGRPREAWVLEWPGQVVLVGSAIFWTAEVSASLSSEATGEHATEVHWAHVCPEAYSLGPIAIGAHDSHCCKVRAAVYPLPCAGLSLQCNKTLALEFIQQLQL